MAIARGELATGIELIREALELLHAEQHNILLTAFARARLTLKAGNSWNWTDRPARH